MWIMNFIEMKTSSNLPLDMLLTMILYLFTCHANPVEEAIAGMSLNESISSMGEKFWKLRNESRTENLLFELKKLITHERIRYLSIYLEEINFGDAKFFLKLDETQQKMEEIDNLYEDALICGTEKLICPRSVLRVLDGIRCNQTTKIDLIYQVLEHIEENDFRKTCLSDDNRHSVHELADFYRQMIQAAEVKAYLIIRFVDQIALECESNTTAYYIKNKKYLEQEYEMKVDNRGIKERIDRSRLNNETNKLILSIYCRCQVVEGSKEVNITEVLMEKIEALEKKHSRMIKRFKTHSFVSRDVWRCDPSNGFKEDISYIKLKRVFQGFIIPQSNILHENPAGFLPAFCIDDGDFCGSANPARQNFCVNGSDSICELQDQCGGNRTLWNCKKRFFNDGILDLDFFLSSNKFNICPAERETERRYDYARSDKTHLGTKDTCNRAIAIEKNVFNLFGNCFLCYCTCDDQNLKLSERTFSTHVTLSDFDSNYVVTGARIRKKYGIVYIEVQQGLLLANGTVNSSSVRWKEVTADILKDPSKQFHLNWKNSRSIQLEDINLPSSDVLVGLGFQKKFSKGINRLKLVALGRGFDFSSGKISDRRTLLYRKKNFRFTETGFDVHEHSLPANLNNFIITKTSISFDISDLKSDLGQTTIPFIDIQDVVPKTPTLMGGAGLYYKYPGKKSKRAGYIGLKLKIYNHTAGINFH